MHLPIEWAVSGWAVLLAFALHAFLRTLRPAFRRDFLPLSIQQHAWLAGIVCLGVLWSLQIRIGSGLHLSMIGVSLYALVFGHARALLGAAVALIGQTAFTDGAWLELGMTGVLIVVLPSMIASTLQHVLSSRLPRHLFVFIIGNGLFVTLIASGCASVAFLALQIAIAPSEVADVSATVGYALLLAWGEALASGMIFSSLVIFRPQIVMTYSPDDYLPRQR
jgi:uncharacterized membrane protein